MWTSFRCKPTTGRRCYMGFQTNYENLLAYLLQDPDGRYKRYNELVWINANEFEEQYATICDEVNRLRRSMTNTPSSRSTDTAAKNATMTEEERPSHTDDVFDAYDSDEWIGLVEPRELLHLLNYIETHDTRFVYVPRPFHRSNVFGLTSLVRMDECSVLGCIFCGQQSSYVVSGESVCFSTLALKRLRTGNTRQSPPITYSIWNFVVPRSDLGGPMYNNDIDHEQQTPNLTPVFKEIRRLHHACCPVMWLHDDENANWNYKDASFTLRGVSKFQHLMQFLCTYPRPRENWSWLTFSNKLAHCLTPGASQHTIENLLRIVCNERLQVLSDRHNSTVVTPATAVYGVIKHRHNASRVASPEQRLWDPSTATERGSSACTSSPPNSDTRIIQHDRLEAPAAHASSSGTSSDGFHCEPNHVNAYMHDMINLADENEAFDEPYGYQLADLVVSGTLPYGGSYTVIPPIGEEPVSRRFNELRRASEPRRQRHASTQTSFCNDRAEEAAGVSAALRDGTIESITLYRLLYLQGYLIRRKDTIESDNDQSQTDGYMAADVRPRPVVGTHVCLYCCAVFTDVSANYCNADEYYTRYQAYRILRYALYGCVDATSTTVRTVYGRRLASVPRFPVVFFKDLNPGMLPSRLQGIHEQDRRLKQALIRLSVSLDTSHKQDCVFRVKRREFTCTECRICLEACEEANRCTMSCGHWFCRSCYNEIALTDCCLCKKGHRTQPMSVTSHVVRGYAKSRHFMSDGVPLGREERSFSV